MTLPIFRAKGAASGGSNSQPIPAPAGVATGDLLIAFVGANGGPPDWTIMAPSGWTLGGKNLAPDAFGYNLAWFYKVAGGSEPANYSFDLQGTGGTVTICAWSGVNTTTPLNATPVAQNNASASTILVPSITTTVADCLLVAFYNNMDTAANPYDPPVGMTERVDYNAGNVSLGAAELGLTSAGASGTKTVGMLWGGKSWATAIALNPAVPGGGGGGADTTAPVLTNASGTATGTTTATVQVTTDEGAGTLHCLVSTNATESAATIKASGATQAVSSTGVKTFSITGLNPATQYYSHFVQRDAASTPNESAVANGSGFVTSTPADTTPPTLSAPTAAQTGSTTATWGVTTDEANGLLYVYFSANATETTATVIANGTSQAVSSAGAKTGTKTGLSPSTMYYAHFAHRDVANNVVTNAANSASITTAAASSAGSFSASGTLKNLNGSVLPNGVYSVVFRSLLDLNAAPVAVKTSLTVTNGIAPAITNLAGTVPGTTYVYEPVNEADHNIRGLARAVAA